MSSTAVLERGPTLRPHVHQFRFSPVRVPETNHPPTWQSAKKSLGRIAGLLDDPEELTNPAGRWPRVGRRKSCETKLLIYWPIQARPGKAQASIYFRFVTSLDEVLCQPVCEIGQRSERNMIDDERNGSAEFSDLYVRLLRAALDETSWSLSPWMRERRLANHVSREVSMTCMTDESLRLRGAFNRGSGNGEEPLL
jgi:hypothetical protein